VVPVVLLDTVLEAVVLLTVFDDELTVFDDELTVLLTVVFVTVSVAKANVGRRTAAITEYFTSSFRIALP
jgi:hypothetical protein